MANYFGTVINFILILFVLACWLFIAVKLVKERYAGEKKVEAVVVDKYKADTVAKMHGTFKREKYVVVFLTDKKKLAFNVSEFSYHGYKIREKGILKYKGNKIIDFS